MQVHENFAAGVLITGGLGANAESGALITAAKWHLFGCEATITIPTTQHGGGGGSVPLAPGEIHNFYKPVSTKITDFDNNQYVDYKNNLKLRNIVKITFKFNDVVNEREFVLKNKPMRALVKLISISTNIGNNINIIVKSIKRRINDINIIIKRMKLRK